MSYFLKIRCDFIYILLPNVKNCDGKDTFEFHKGCRRSRYNFNVDVFMLETMMMVVTVMVIQKSRGVQQLDVKERRGNIAKIHYTKKYKFIFIIVLLLRLLLFRLSLISAHAPYILFYKERKETD